MEKEVVDKFIKENNETIKKMEKENKKVLKGKVVFQRSGSDDCVCCKGKHIFSIYVNWDKNEKVHVCYDNDYFKGILNKFIRDKEGENIIVTIATLEKENQNHSQTNQSRGHESEKSDALNNSEKDVDMSSSGSDTYEEELKKEIELEMKKENYEEELKKEINKLSLRLMNKGDFHTSMNRKVCYEAGYQKAKEEDLEIINKFELFHNSKKYL